MSLEFELPLLSLIFIVLLAIVYFMKNRLKLPENKMYETILICTILEVSINTVIHFICAVNDFQTLNSLYYSCFNYLNKILAVLFVIIFASLFVYTMMITYDSIRKDAKNFIKKIVCIESVFALVVLFTNIQLVEVGNVTNVTGMTIQLGYIVVALFLIATLFVTLLNIKKIDKRYYVIFIILFISAVLYAISLLFPGIIIYDLILVLLCYIMYFTIENPDIKMIEELTKAKELVDKNNNDKSIFIFNTTQQIRHPLNIIEQRTEQILDANSMSVVREKVMDIRNAQQKISSLVNGALDISTLDAKKIPIVNASYNVHNLLKELSIRTQKVAESKNIDFRTDFSPAVPKQLQGDSIRLKQIISSLLSNSLKYTEKGFIELSVNAIIRFDVCRLIVSIKDSGVGFQMEEVDRLFERKRNKPLVEKDTDSKEISLDVVKKMVNLIGGTITVESEKNRGSDFTLVIDQKIVEEKDSVTDMIQKYDKLYHKHSMLFVSDQEAEQLFYRKKLSGLFRIEIAKNGEECLNRIREGEIYDFLLIQENMEKLSGTTVVDKLRKLENFKIPIVILTNDKKSKELLIKKGYDNIITQEMTQSQLLKFLEKYK